MDSAAHLFGENYIAIKQYVDILLSEGVEWGLLGPREAGRIWERHIFNSLALADLVPQGSSVVDIGSGAGLPGIPLALYRPDLRITLLESLLRRVNFLELAVARLGLANRVTVVRGRAEEHRTRYDAVVSRAVAPLGRLLDWSLPLAKPGGTVLALKGERANQELDLERGRLARDGLTGEVVGVRVPGTDESTWVVQVNRRRTQA